MRGTGKRGRSARRALPAAAAFLVAIASVSVGRQIGGNDFAPALAVTASPTAAPASEATGTLRDAKPVQEETPADAASSPGTAQSSGVAQLTTSPDAAPSSIEEPSPSDSPASARPAPSSASGAEILAPPPAIANPVPTPSPARAVPEPCPANWFCYPRLGVAGPIVPYADCSGSTDVGIGIRSFTCINDHYLMGHAYTQFGLIRQWVSGDAVFAYGTRFTVSGAVVQTGCAAPLAPIAPLALQTSLTSSSCGPVLVVQAR